MPLFVNLRLPEHFHFATCPLFHCLVKSAQIVSQSHAAFQPASLFLHIRAKSLDFSQAYQLPLKDRKASPLTLFPSSSPFYLCTCREFPFVGFIQSPNVVFTDSNQI